MSNRYAIWDRTSDIYTPGTDPNITGLTYSTIRGTNHFTAEEWLELHQVPDSAIIICAAGDYNGGYFGTLNNMISVYGSAGVDFSECVEAEDYLNAIEAWETTPIGDPTESTPEQRIAAALELANLLSMETVNNNDPEE